MMSGREKNSRPEKGRIYFLSCHSLFTRTGHRRHSISHTHSPCFVMPRALPARFCGCRCGCLGNTEDNKQLQFSKFKSLNSNFRLLLHGKKSTTVLCTINQNSHVSVHGSSHAPHARTDTFSSKSIVAAFFAGFTALFQCIREFPYSTRPLGK